MAKIAISLPDSVLESVERERRARGETRSEFLRRALEAFLRHERERQAVELYVRGYQQQPETEEEMGWVETASQAALAASPWDDEPVP